MTGRTDRTRRRAVASPPRRFTTFADHALVERGVRQYARYYGPRAA
ncbi:MAG TPA: hypothetical protein VLW50_27120 [Streptosporangiaceae bacterium]|nr:hypothetical protein [Streptosporangiaceae bacterium]